MKPQGEGKIGRLEIVLEDLEEEQRLNSEAQCSDPVLDMLVIGLHAYICNEVCSGPERERNHVSPCHNAELTEGYGTL